MSAPSHPFQSLAHRGTRLTHRMCIRVYGLTVELRVNCPHLLGRLIEYFPPGWDYGPLNVTPDRRYGIIDAEASSDVGRRRDFRYGFEVDDCTFIASDSELELSREFESDLHDFLAVYAAEHLFIQAGVVAWCGRAIVLPGKSNTGKSTLVAELVRLGGIYYSDESAVFDPAGFVIPYPRALYLTETPASPPCRFTAQELGGETGQQPVPVGLYVFTEYREGATWQPQIISGTEASNRLLENSPCAQARHEFAQTLLDRILSGTAAVHGPRGEAGDAAPDILARLTNSIQGLTL